MKYLISIILAVMGIVSAIAATAFHSHLSVAILLYVLCMVLLVVALIIGYVESLPRPHIIVAGYGRLPGTRIDGLLIANDGEPAYNISPPNPVPLSGAKVIFKDPVITRLGEGDGPRCFPVEVETSLGGGAVNGLHQDMALRGVHELNIEFNYADGKHPMYRRYTTVAKLKLTQGIIVAMLVKQKFRWFPLWRD